MAVVQRRLNIVGLDLARYDLLLMHRVLLLEGVLLGELYCHVLKAVSPYSTFISQVEHVLLTAAAKSRRSRDNIFLPYQLPVKLSASY